MFVSDDNGTIQIFNSVGNYVTRWSYRAYYIAIDNDGNIYLGGGGSVLKLDSSGRIIAKVGKPGDGDGEFSFATGVAVDQDGNIYVCDESAHRIQKFLLLD